MTAERWQRVKQIFFCALECSSLEERSRLVIRLCEGDPSLEAEVSSLLEWFWRSHEPVCPLFPRSILRAPLSFHARARLEQERVGELADIVEPRLGHSGLLLGALTLRDGDGRLPH